MSPEFDRRRTRRYGVRLKLRWKLTNSQRMVLDQGTGLTVDVSSTGLQFEGSQPLRVGEILELFIDWPAMLDDITPLQFFVSGIVVRSRGKQTAVRIIHHGFRTRSMSGNIRELLASSCVT